MAHELAPRRLSNEEASSAFLIMFKRWHQILNYPEIPLADVQKDEQFIGAAFKITPEEAMDISTEAMQAAREICWGTPEQAIHTIW